jgi:hypothetical protein
MVQKKSARLSQLCSDDEEDGPHVVATQALGGHVAYPGCRLQPRTQLRGHAQAAALCLC